MSRIHRIGTVFLIVVTIIFLSILIVWRFRLGLVRYFDMDEFAYFNWAYHVTTGNKPYTDFMMLVTPLYVYFLAPIFWVFTDTAAVLVSRNVAFGITLGMGATLAWLFWEIRKSWLALAVPFILFMLPMPSDKFLEVRPDNLSLVLLLVGLIFHVRWMKGKVKEAFWSGVFYSLSLLTLQKTFVYVLIASVVALFQSQKELRIEKLFKWPFAFYVIGAILPWSVFAGWAIATKQPEIVWYSVVKLPIESAAIKLYHPLHPFFYFTPNITYYGEWGLNQGILVTYIIWIAGITIALFRWLTAFFPQTKDKGTQFLVSSFCLYAVISYIWFLPLKHPQYLIPAAVFVVWFVADGVRMIWHRLKRSWVGSVMFFLLYLGGAWVLYRTFFVVHLAKFTWTNESQLAKMERIYKTIDRSSYILDLEGGTIYYPYPYYVCCLSFGQFGPYLTRSLPSLPDALLQTKTKYIYQAGINRVGALIPEDREFIEKNYSLSKDGEMYIARQR